MPLYEKIPIGAKQNRLTVVEDLGMLYTSESKKYKAHFVLVQCDCGVIKKINYQQFKTKHTKSCGCLNEENILVNARTHGGSVEYPRLYRIWKDMKRRCYSPNRKNYVRYGAKGIRVCDEWKNDFESFKTWSLKNGYIEESDERDKMNKLSIDRIDPNKNYEPSNCRWISLYDNVLHARRTKYEYIAICPQGNIYTFTIASQFEREHSLVKGSIVRCCVNNKPYKGWQFKRKPIE